MNCPNCTNTIPNGTAFCPYCGAPTNGAAAPRNGAAIAGATAVPRYQHLPTSRITYILLAIFLGGFGIHNFVAGYTGRGVAQLLLTILSCGVLALPVGIWVIIEACTVTADADGVPFV